MRSRLHATRLIAALTAVLGFASATLGAADGNALDDGDITIAVTTALIVDESVPAHSIDVSTENGFVTLSGSVDTYYAKLEAEDEASGVKGVVAVINELEVEPLSRSDSQVQSDVIAALAADPVADAFEIDVHVDDGFVTLDGAVDSYSERTLAKDVASGVKGVVGVANRLTYDVADDRSDVDVMADVRQRLRSDASIDSGQITVLVDDGAVTLDGTVSSALEQSEAENEAWLVPGVESVENNLEVQWWAGETSDWVGGWTDEDAEEAIEADLTLNPRVASFDVDAEVDEGVATLTGEVEDLDAKRTAADEALDTLGVWRVKNYLRVRPDINLTDAEIAEDVRDALRRDPYIDRYDVAVTVYNGKVYLGGEVDSWYPREKAATVAAGISGVIDVQNRLKVDYEFTAKSDAEIEDDINSEFFWSPFVDSDDVTVAVEDGVATVYGTVDDWGDVLDVKENAREGGATSVISKLNVRNP